MTAIASAHAEKKMRHGPGFVEGVGLVLYGLRQTGADRLLGLARAGLGLLLLEAVGRGGAQSGPE